jgi:hypothetical protein
MTETPDPLKALDGKSIAERAAGARDLSLVGEVQHLERLAVVAGTDRSPGVRLSAAAAAADILSRHRVGAAAKTLSPRKRNTLAALFRRIDPSINPGVFSVFGCLDRPAAHDAICGGLRDPRGDVRLGAAVGLLRLCTSLSVAGNAKVEKRVVALLGDSRHKPDALAEVARVCAAAGYSSAADAIRALVLPGAHGDLVAEASAILGANAAPVDGLWFSDGLDAGETNPSSPLGGALALVDEKGAMICAGGTWKATKGFPGAEVRRMYFRKVGALDAAPAFQADGRTWYGGAGPDLLCVIDSMTSPGEIDWDKQARSTAAAKGAIAEVGVHLGETSGAHRARALLLAAVGERDGAIEALGVAAGLKKVFPDTWALLGDALWATGKKKAAKGHYATFIKKARKRDFPEAYARAKSRAG